MNPKGNHEGLSTTLLVNMVAIAVFLAALHFLGLTLPDIYSSFRKLAGAVIFLFGCVELAWSARRFWKMWRSTPFSQTSK